MAIESPRVLVRSIKFRSRFADVQNKRQNVRRYEKYNNNIVVIIITLGCAYTHAYMYVL